MAVDFSSMNRGLIRSFSTPAVLTRASDGTTEPFTGIFEAPHQDVGLRLTPGASLFVSSSEPSIWVDVRVARPSDPAGDLLWKGALPTQDDVVAIAGTMYRVYDPQPDSEGGLRLVLKQSE